MHDNFLKNINFEMHSLCCIVKTEMELDVVQHLCSSHTLKMMPSSFSLSGVNQKSLCNNRGSGSLSNARTEGDSSQIHSKLI